MPLRFALLAALVLTPTLILTSCASDASPPTPDTQVREFLGADILDVLENAERFESWRVKRHIQGEPLGISNKAAGVELLSKGPDLDEDQARRLRAMIYASTSYEWDMAKGCIPTPGIHFRAIRGEDTVDVSLCFECKMWGFGKNLGPSDFPPTWEDFDPVTRGLKTLSKELFPNDPAIQGL